MTTRRHQAGIHGHRVARPPVVLVALALVLSGLVGLSPQAASAAPADASALNHVVLSGQGLLANGTLENIAATGLPAGWSVERSEGGTADTSSEAAHTGGSGLRLAKARLASAPQAAVAPSSVVDLST